MAKKPRAVAKKSVPPRRASKPPAETTHPTEVVELSTLRPHPENYKAHPDEQLEHIAASIRRHGYYRNVVVARDGTILAGHGVAEAATKKLGYTRGPVVRLPIAFDSPEALKVLALKELPKFGETDDRKLSEILRRIRDEDSTGLLGTGYEDQKLAALLMETRPEAEIRTIDEANEWVGMPEYEVGATQLKIAITFKDVDRKRFAEAAGLRIDKYEKYTWSTRWPFTEREDAHSLRFESAERIRAAENPGK